MATQVQFRRGTSAQTALFTGVSGEIVVDTYNNTISVQDGVTQGGTYLAKQNDMLLGFTQVNSNIANVSIVTNAAYSQSNIAFSTATSANNTAIATLNYLTANVSYFTGVNATQNTNITVAYNLAQGAYNKANTIPTNAAFNQAVLLSQSAYNTANLAAQKANSIYGGSF